MLNGCGQDFQLDGPAQKAVHRLLADQSKHAHVLGDGLCLHEVPAGKVGGAEVQDLALLTKNREGFPNFFPRSVAIHVMHLVQVDVVRLQTLE